MKSVLLTKMSRRGLFRAAAAPAALAASGTVTIEAAAVEPIGKANKRKSRYQPSSPEVQTYYRVNSYPAR